MRQKVAVLGATGMVGRRFTELLLDHPWFEASFLVGAKAVGARFGEVWRDKEAALARHYGDALWKPRPLPAALADVPVRSFEELLAARSRIDTVFSSVPPECGHLEDALVEAGFRVFSNSPHRRHDPDCPLVVAEVNAGDLRDQRHVKTPNCVASGLALVLAPLLERYGLREVSVVTLQSLSGRGDAKYATELIVGNVYPLHASSEGTELNITRELRRMLGPSFGLSVSCNRVFVQEGHLFDVKLKTERPVGSVDEVAELLAGYDPLRELSLPSRAAAPLVVTRELGRPRPCQDKAHGNGMSVAVGSLSIDDSIYDLRLQGVVNNLVRGAAGGAILNAEICALRSVQRRCA
jgi:aspartate-semialdehyde dehydrogenase